MATNNKQLPPPRVEAIVPIRSMQQLLNQIDQIKIDVETRIKTLKKIDTGHKKAIVNRDRSVEGRIQIKTLIEHIIDLQKQMNIMTKESDPIWPTKRFDKSKRNALKILSNLLNQLNHVDKHLEKATGTIPTAIYINNQPVITKGGHTKKTASSAAIIRRTPSLSESDEEITSDEDEEESESEEDRAEYVVTERKQEPQNSSRLIKKTKVSSDESQDEDYVRDNYQLLNELQNKKLLGDHLTDSSHSDRQLHTPSPSYINKKPATFKIHSSPSSLSSSSMVRKPVIVSSSTPLSRTRTPSSQQSIIIPISKEDDKSEDDSYFEDDDDDDREQEESQPAVVNAYVQKLRREKYLPGTQFRVTHSLKGLEIGDLTIHKGEILILVEQKSDDWWLFKNLRTQQQGLVPINHIQLESRTSDYRIKRTTSSSTLVDLFKTNNYIPSGFIASDLAPLTQDNRYKLSRTLIPKMSESNFAFSDLYWRFDKDQISLQQAEYQKILTIKKCLKIPKIKGEHIRVLNRCIRVCLYDGFEIISNIHSTRVKPSNKITDHNLTENWHFKKPNDNTFLDEQSQFLIRSDEYHPSKHLYLLIELSQLCQSKINQKTCEIGSGWIMISLDDNNETKSYNKRLQGGHYHQTNILLNSQYKNFHSNGLAGKIDRYKQARIRFSIESRETSLDLLYDNLPLTSMIIPINLIRILAFYRNELAYQLQKRLNLSTKPIDSIFLSTFYQTLEQPDLIYVLQRLSNQFQDLTKREEFIKIYELSIYPLLFYCLLPSYNFHDISIINQRRKLISEIISKELSTKKNQKLDILSLLLDPTLTDKWTLFTTDEICFSLQNYVK